MRGAAVATGPEGIEAIQKRTFDLVITDLRLPGADGLTVLKTAKEKAAQTEVLMITAHGSVETAVGAMKLGAFDYITKPFQMDELLLIIERIGGVIALRRENQDLKHQLEDKFCFHGILGATARCGRFWTRSRWWRKPIPRFSSSGKVGRERN